MKTDIEIAHSTELKRIDEVAKQLGIDPEAIEHYGKQVAIGMGQLRPLRRLCGSCVAGAWSAQPANKRREYYYDL